MRRADLTKLSPESGQGLRARKFRMAQRHSRRVRLLRWLLPSAAVSVLAIVTFFVWFDPLRFYRNLPVDFGRISITDNKLTIEAPKLTGFTQDRRPYWVTAESAAQDLGARDAWSRRDGERLLPGPGRGGGAAYGEFPIVRFDGIAQAAYYAGSG